MTLIDIINLKLARRDPNTVLRKMGYRNSEHAKERLESLRRAGSIESWLRQSSYDLYYSGKEFLRVLFDVLMLPAGPLEEELKRIDAKEITLARMRQPYIFVDTNFKRQSQPIFALAMMESRRRIRIDKEEIYGRELDDVLKLVGGIIRRHYRRSGGKLPMWGTIRRYIYHHGDGRSFLFDTEGNLIHEVQEVEERARMRLHGRPLNFLLEGEKREKKEE